MERLCHVTSLLLPHSGKVLAFYLYGKPSFMMANFVKKKNVYFGIDQNKSEGKISVLGEFPP